MTSVPAYLAYAEGLRLAELAQRADENIRAAAALHPFVSGQTFLNGMLHTQSNGEQVQVRQSGSSYDLWTIGSPYLTHRAEAFTSLSSGVKKSTPWRPRAVLAHVRAHNHESAAGGRESRTMIFELEGDGVDGPQPVWNPGAGVAAGDREHAVECEFHADGFTLTRSGDDPADIELVSAVAVGEAAGTPDAGFGAAQAIRETVSASGTPLQIAEARNAAHASVRSRSRGPAEPVDPLVGELWGDTVSGWVRQWTGAAWVNVFPLDADADAPQLGGPFSSPPAFGARTAFGVKDQVAALVQVRYPRAGMDTGTDLVEEGCALLVGAGEYFAVSSVEDPTAEVSTSEGITKKTVKLTVDVTGAGWRIDKASDDSDSTDAVAAVDVVNVIFIGVW